MARGSEEAATSGPPALSRLTLSLVGSVRPADVGSIVARLRRARAEGVTSFDLVEAADPALARSLLARAFPEGDSAVVVIAPFESRHDPAPGSRAPSSRIPAPALAVGEDLAPRRSGAPEFATVYESTRGGGMTTGMPARSDRAGRSPPGRPEILRCDSVDDLAGVPTAPSQVWVSGSHSLLEPGLLEAASLRLGGGRLRWLGRDPFAGGRLDGSRFLSAGSMSAGVPVRTVRELESEFAPVARFGFLALPRRRTLAQAALWYALDRPEVVSVCLPLPPPERWEELLGFSRSPPLTEVERERIRELDLSSGAGRPSAADGA